MSLLSQLKPVFWVYFMGFRVILEQLFRRLSHHSLSQAVFPLQNGKVAIVTGGIKGIGYHTAKNLARLGMHVIIAGNDEKIGQRSVMKIKEEILNAKVEFLYCDLASMKSIHQFVKEFKAKNFPLHVLINNAGVMLVPEKKTEDGFEEHISINYLGHFLLTNLLLDILKQSGTHSHNARIVNLSSATHYVGELHLPDLQSSCSYSPHGAYAQSKLALVLFSYQLQHLLTLEGSHVTVNVVDPGVVNTGLYQHVRWAVKMVKWIATWLLKKPCPRCRICLARLQKKVHLHQPMQQFHRNWKELVDATFTTSKGQNLLMSLMMLSCRKDSGQKAADLLGFLM